MIPRLKASASAAVRSCHVELGERALDFSRWRTRSSRMRSGSAEGVPLRQSRRHSKDYCLAGAALLALRSLKDWGNRERYVGSRRGFVCRYGLEPAASRASPDCEL